MKYLLYSNLTMWKLRGQTGNLAVSRPGTRGSPSSWRRVESWSSSFTGRIGGRCALSNSANWRSLWMMSDTEWHCSSSLKACCSQRWTILIKINRKRFQLLWFKDKVPESLDNKEAQVAEAAQDLQAAGEDAEAGADEHQRGDLGQTPQEEHQAGPERPRPGRQTGGPGRLRWWVHGYMRQRSPENVVLVPTNSFRVIVEHNSRNLQLRNQCNKTNEPS